MHNFVVSDNYALCIKHYEFFLKNPLTFCHKMLSLHFKS